MNIQHRLELFRMLSSLCDGQLAETEHNRLEEMLAADAEARRLYLQYIDMHARLLVHPGLAGRQRLAGSAVVAEASEGNFVSSAAGKRSAVVELPAGRRQRDVRRLLPYAMVAAATLAATLLAQVFVWRPQPAATVVADGSGGHLAEPSPYVATLARTADAEWEEVSQPPQSGSRFVPGDVHLKKGLAHIRLDSGADLVVEGPAVVRLESIAAAALILGKVVFRTDAIVAPLTLTTPMSIFMDSNAVCGVEVKSDREEVHVFAGLIQRLPKLAQTHDQGQLLVAGTARRFAGSAPGPGEPTPFDPERFTRELPDPALADPTAGLVAYEGFDYRDPADLGSHLAKGGIGWSGPWEYGHLLPPRLGLRLAAPLNVQVSILRDDAPAASVGGSFDWIGEATYHRLLATPVRLNADGIYYLSYLFNRDGPVDEPFSPPNSVSVELRQVADLNQEAIVGRPDSWKRLSVGVDRGNELVTSLERAGNRAPLPLSYNAPYLLVAKIVASAANPDQVFVRVYGPQESVDREEPESWTAVCPPVSSDLVFDSLELAINSRRRQTIDEVRLGTTWPSVTAPWVASAPAGTGE